MQPGNRGTKQSARELSKPHVPSQERMLRTGEQGHPQSVSRSKGEDGPLDTGRAAGPEEQ